MNIGASLLQCRNMNLRIPHSTLVTLTYYLVSMSGAGTMRRHLNKRKTVVAAAISLVEIALLSRNVSSALADDVELGAEQDATLLGGSDATTNNSLADPGIFVGTDGEGNPKRGLIEFNIAAAIPSGATITAVQLQMT